jgi:hypothetical protein
MLQDPISLLSVANIKPVALDGTPLRAFFVTDPGSTLGRTVRQGSSKTFSNVKLGISHSESKESKPYGTKRLSLRVDAVKGAGTPEEPIAQPFVQIIFGQPKALVSSAEMYELGVLLLTFALVGEAIPEVDVDSSHGAAVLARLLNGEG